MYIIYHGRVGLPVINLSKSRADLTEPVTFYDYHHPPLFKSLKTFFGKNNDCLGSITGQIFTIKYGQLACDELWPHI